MILLMDCPDLKSESKLCKRNAVPVGIKIMYFLQLVQIRIRKLANPEIRIQGGENKCECGSKIGRNRLPI